MKSSKSIIAILLVVCMLGGLVANVSAVSVNAQSPDKKLKWHVINSKNETKNIKDCDALLKKAKKQHKKIFVNVYTDYYCSGCYKMDKTTFSNPQVKAKLKNYILIKVNAAYAAKLSKIPYTSKWISNFTSSKFQWQSD
ncbi:MAG: thioredoxin family protein [Methanobacterium sp.]|nr:thioredoxin family protein [Methanobacterium sp.]